MSGCFDIVCTFMRSYWKSSWGLYYIKKKYLYKKNEFGTYSVVVVFVLSISFVCVDMFRILKNDKRNATQRIYTKIIITFPRNSHFFSMQTQHNGISFSPYADECRRYEFGWWQGESQTERIITFSERNKIWYYFEEEKRNTKAVYS